MALCLSLLVLCGLVGYFCFVGLRGIALGLCALVVGICWFCYFCFCRDRWGYGFPMRCFLGFGLVYWLRFLVFRVVGGGFGFVLMIVWVF